MEDDQQAPSQEDTPTPAESTPSGDTESTQVVSHDDESLGWEERYKNLQSVYTRTSQEAAELKQQREQEADKVAFFEALQAGDRTAYTQIAEAYGVDPDEFLRTLGLTEEEQEALEDEDTPEFRDPRVDTMLAEQQEREALQVAQQMSEHIVDLAKAEDLNLTERAKAAIYRDAVENGANPEGTEKAFKDYLEDIKFHREDAVKSYRGSKKAPSPPVSGSSGVPVKDLSSDKNRLAFANEVAQRSLDSAG